MKTKMKDDLEDIPWRPKLLSARRTREPRISNLSHFRLTTLHLQFD